MTNAVADDELLWTALEPAEPGFWSRPGVTVEVGCIAALNDVQRVVGIGVENRTAGWTVPLPPTLDLAPGRAGAGVLPEFVGLVALMRRWYRRRKPVGSILGLLLAAPCAGFERSPRALSTPNE